MKVPEHFFEETDTNLVETDGFVNYAMQVDNVEIGLLFTESDKTIKISFRARGDVWVNELAKEFGGNGHQHAAGATIPDGNLDELIQSVIKSAPKYLS
jgi:bifunctional oligoribonuclease and PAP phosphatase NrnA